MFAFLDKLALNKGLMLLLCSVALALLCVEICFAVVRGKMQSRQVPGYICRGIVALAAAVLAGFLVSLIPAAGVWRPVLFYALPVLAVAAAVVVYIAGARRAVRLATANSLRASAANTAVVRHAKGWLFGTCVALMVAAAVALAFGWNYYLLMFPVAVVAVLTLIHALLRWRIWYALGSVAILVYAAMSLWGYFQGLELSSLPVVSGASAAAALISCAFVTLTVRKE